MEYPYYPVEYPPWRCCASHSGEEEKTGETIPQSAYPKCPPLPIGDWCAQLQHQCCTSEQLDYAVREWVCSAPTTLCATPSTMSVAPPEQLDCAAREWVCRAGTYPYARANAAYHKVENQ